MSQARKSRIEEEQSGRRMLVSTVALGSKKLWCQRAQCHRTTVNANSVGVGIP